MLNFLNLLNKNNIEYVSWKNNHEVSEYLKGNGDLDILVECLSQIKFRVLAKENDWLELENPIASFPNISHFYKISDTGIIFHLHVYFEIVTGESWLKEFVLPLKKFLLSNRVKCRENNIWVLSSETQAYMFLIRHLLKAGSFTSRWLYWQDFKSYKTEWLHCDMQPQRLNGFGPIALDTYINKSGLAGVFRVPSFWNAVRFRLSMSKYCRFSIIWLPFLRLSCFFNRLLNKLINKKKKFLGEGLIVAISGADGSGKSSMIEGLETCFSSFLCCNVYQLGKPQGRVIEFFRLLVKPRAVFPDSERNDLQNDTSLRKALALVVLGFLRLRKAKIARAKAKNGSLILVDRWPTSNFGKMDSPKIKIQFNSSWLLKKMAQVEKKTYEKIPKADLCFNLKVSVETAISRNDFREKIGKETKEEIMLRHAENEAVIPLTNKVINFVNEGSFNERLLELQNRVWKEIIEFKSVEKLKY